MAENHDHLFIQFYVKPVENKVKSADAGRPIFDEKEMIKIRIAGDKGTELHAPVNEASVYVAQGPGQKGRRLTYVEQFPEQYEAFKAGREQAVSGTPIEEATFLTVSQRAELKALNIYTVEALAGMEAADKLGMSGSTMVEHARAYLDRAKGASSDGELIHKNKALELRLTEMQEQIAQLMKGGHVEPAAQTAVDGEAEPEATAEDEVTEDGPFYGYNSKALRAFIKDKTGKAPLGNPKLSTLLTMAKECAESEPA
ncbi:MAG: hypothetical protein AAFP81_17480 [Pseudomonadota bacterium]